MIGSKPYAPATERNSTPILAVLQHEFRHATSVLEIGSGTGQHAARCDRVALQFSFQSMRIDVALLGEGIFLGAAFGQLRCSSRFVVWRTCGRH